MSSSSSLPPSESSLPPSSDRGSSPSPPVSLSGAEDEVVRLRRMLATIQEKLAVAEDKRAKIVKTAKTLGRGIPKVVDLWTDIESLIHLADVWDNSVANGVEIVSLSEEKREEMLACQRARSGVVLLPSIIPNFVQKVNSSTPEELHEWCAALQEGATNARSDDVNRLRAACAEWLNKDLSATPMLNGKSREGRGLQHDLCGRLLSSIEHDWSNPESRARIRDGEEGFECGTLSRALYEGYVGDPSNIEQGYLRSRLLLKTYLHIFTSPSSSDNLSASDDGSDDTENTVPSTHASTKRSSRKPVRKSVSATLNMGEKVTPRAIAYAAVHLLLSLSSAPSWCASHQGLNFREVYYYIIDFFEDVDNDPQSAKVAKDLLKWWNTQIYPHAQVASTTSARTKDKLAAQRAARRAKALDVLNC